MNLNKSLIEFLINYYKRDDNKQEVYGDNEIIHTKMEKCRLKRVIRPISIIIGMLNKIWSVIL